MIADVDRAQSATTSLPMDLHRLVTVDTNGVLQTPHGDAKPNTGKSIIDVEAIVVVAEEEQHRR